MAAAGVRSKQHIIIRPAGEFDVPAIGRMMVETYLRAHKGQIPDGAWEKRQQEWTWEVSAAGWSRALREIADGSSPNDCIFLAVDPAAGDGQERIAGVVLGGPAEAGPWEQAGEIFALYVDFGYHRRGLGRELVRAAVRHLREAGMDRLVIRSLAANEPANRFYEALGGKIMGKLAREEYGFSVLEQVYGWEDSSILFDEDGR